MLTRLKLLAIRDQLGNLLDQAGRPELNLRALSMRDTVRSKIAGLTGSPAANVLSHAIDEFEFVVDCISVEISRGRWNLQVIGFHRWPL